ncbi:hypothetical protein N0B30_22660 (plasmid) [Bacillus subtilis]|uniref:hypothetical protein n=1 Tax=Bacillus subtilis group TaxID=653685 RepID=UPI001939EF8A|nr:MULTISPECIES: hypothetical protein [Bacillus subtilis group]MCT6515434.1 hypothetical protein [Bacillus subtilis]MEC0407581.1 hypothetical protein [Bacillus subtilis]MEC0419540.1 hypothetical protein [Bacillus subtilis]MEC0436834.1 hypothetical protein [Bacillus subtilis]MEC0449039.1 hypothetical protein [Bacillus subtilis]
MTFKKAFIIGYVVLLLSFVLVYFIFPAEQVITAVIILTLLFGVYQLILLKKLYKNQD